MVFSEAAVFHRTSLRDREARLGLPAEQAMLRLGARLETLVAAFASLSLCVCVATRRECQINNKRWDFFKLGTQSRTLFDEITNDSCVASS